MSAFPSPRRVAIVMAMAAEAEALREVLGTQIEPSPPWADQFPCVVHRATAVGSRPEIVLVENGVDPRTGVDCIGTTAAALAATVAIGVGEPDLVLSVGTAGGWARSGASIGDVYVAWDRFVSHDRRIDLPGFDQFGRGDLPAADLRAHAGAIGARLGVVTTGDSLDESPTDAAIIRESGAEVKEMEAAAVAWVAHLHAVPVSAVKAITDLVDGPVDTAEQFTANFSAAVANLTSTTVALLDRIAA